MPETWIDRITHPSAIALLERLCLDLPQTLDGQLVGLYVHGSLANGGFAPGRSDVDLLAATQSELTGSDCDRLIAMHRNHREAGLPLAAHLEVSYIPVDALRRHNPANAVHPALRVDGSFDRDGHGSDWIIQRWLVRERGVTLLGPPPQQLIDPVSPDELRQASAGILREWWLPMLTDTARLQDAEYQAYAVLTMCRSLYTLEQGAVAPKPQAAAHAQNTLDPRWAGLIETALAWREGQPFDRLEEVLDLLRLTLTRAGLR